MPLGGFVRSIPQLGFKGFTSPMRSNVTGIEGGTSGEALGMERQGLRLQGQTATTSKNIESSGLRQPKNKGY